MKREYTRGVFMDIQKLKEMGASEAVWLAVQLSGKKRRNIEEELELVPGQIDRWSSRKDHHTPSLAVLPELIEATTTGFDVAGNVIIQWLFARVRDRNLQYDPKSLTVSELLEQAASGGAELGRTFEYILEAGKDNKVSHLEALRIEKTAAELIKIGQSIHAGVQAYK